MDDQETKDQIAGRFILEKAQQLEGELPGFKTMDVLKFMEQEGLANPEVAYRMMAKEGLVNTETAADTKTAIPKPVTETETPRETIKMGNTKALFDAIDTKLDEGTGMTPPEAPRTERVTRENFESKIDEVLDRE